MSVSLTDLKTKLEAIAGPGSILEKEPMRDHTTFRIGGPADLYARPQSEEALVGLIRFLREAEVPYFLIGNGSNLLVSDEGFRGVIIEAGRALGGCEGPLKADALESDEETYRLSAQAGILLRTLSLKAADEGLTGLEFASGIPGTLGGAVFMNAGAYGGEMKQVVKSARVLDGDGAIRELDNESLGFGYRTSAVSENGYVVLSAELLLKKGDPELIKETIADLRERRMSRQPLEYPSAGSTFKRPEGYFAGKLIMDADLAGETVGGAQVSKKHCGFVINTGDATAKDVRDLIDLVTDKVESEYGVRLEPEVRFLGF